MKNLAAHPWVVLGGAFAFGVLAAFTVPITPVERDRLGPTRDRLLERARGTASEAVQSGKDVIREVLLGA
jgi:hypothetical protein